MSSAGQAPKVLCYSPYNLWELHGLWEITILHALKLRGATVRQVLCDGLYSECDLFWAASAPRHPRSCLQCQAQVTNLAYRMGMEFEWLGRYLTPADFREAQRWANRLDPSDFPAATYKNWHLGEWVESSVHSHFRASELDLTDARIQQGYRRYLYSGLVACFGLSRLLADYRPRLLFLFNGRQSSTRIAFELARRQGIRVICHERGFRSESLRLVENKNCLALSPLKQLWQDWGEIPLTREELETINQYMVGRQYGKDLRWRAFSPPPQNMAELRQKLGLRPQQEVWVLFTSSDDEVISCRDWGGPFASQLEWIEKTIAYVARHPEVALIIRVHPNTAGIKATGANVRQLQELTLLRAKLPPNAQMVMPDDPVSSYSLMELATLGLVYMSIAALEMACKAKPVIVAAGCLVSDLPFVQTVVDPTEYVGLLDAQLSPSRSSNSTEIQRLALRFAYGLFFRLNLPFPLVKMTDPHQGRLAYDSLDALLSGREPHLDRICRIILEGEPVCLPPTTEDRHRSAIDEYDWFKIDPGGESCPVSSPRAAPAPAPSISIIIPAYNKSKYIKATLDSVLEQPFKNFEIIVVDDGSTDNTAELVRSYGKTVRYLYQENDGFQGPGGAINRGLKAARGDYIHCLDADDLVMPDFYEEILKEFNRQAYLGAVATDAQQIDETGATVSYFKLGYFRNMEEFRLEALHHNPIIASSMVVKKQCYEKVGGRQPEYEIADDYELWLRISEHYDIGMVHQPLIKYRVHGSGISQDLEKTRALDKSIVLDYFYRHPLEYFFPILKGNDTPPNRRQAHLKIAEIFYQRRFYEPALLELEKALSYDPDSVICHNFMGVLYYQLGNIPRARTHFTASLKIDPANPNVLDNLAILEGISGAEINPITRKASG